MKNRIAICLIALIMSIATLPVHAAETDANASASAVLELPTKGWNVNNWLKNDASADYRFIKNSEDKTAIEIDFVGEKCPNVVSPIISELTKEFPTEFGSLSFDCRGDGSNQRVTIVFYYESNRYAANVILKHTGWKRITLKSLWKNAKTPAMNPSKISRFFIAAPAACKVAIGPIEFQAPYKAPDAK